jgi:hypothetical protein
MTIEEREQEHAREYNAKWDARVERGNEAMRIVKRHRASGIPLDPDSYGREMRIEIDAAMLRLYYAENWTAGRCIDDPGDAEGMPTKVRKAALGVEM